MPKKRQLALITLARLCESAATSSLQTYIISQLESFRASDGSVSTGYTLAFQVSALNAVVAGPQLFTSVLWGRLVDSRHVGRKYIILLGLFGTGIASLGLGFANSFAAVTFWRFLVGLINGNMGVMRTMIKDIGGDKFEARVVLLLPTAFNVGSILGPAAGSLLADTSAFRWLLQSPYALPNLFNGVCLIASAALLGFGLEETLDGVRFRPGHLLPERLKRLLGRRADPHYQVLMDQDVELDAQGTPASRRPEVRWSFSRIWTPRLVATLVARRLVTMHVGAYPSL
ncbi:major facilitator superfamily protein [Hirsutella rhossiliensis]|uniref:Major facilitator superfamily domain-containing protein n=1 Tax=Hirsutella rhossiliensis TaxID=111463 RepID=A0A9P8MTS7_9HYPO|nr:major facilitator superfamily domain-containing protein [Hirsutella rhossiliensis]KAH0960284.1 major facilitator superfamily domain-containing protein [Hirsutella rhossiliensis]